VDLAAKGKLTLGDMLSFIDIFREEDVKPKVRRGRAPTKRT
jgi:hypothetical protein